MCCKHSWLLKFNSLQAHLSVLEKSMNSWNRHVSQIILLYEWFQSLQPLLKKTFWIYFPYIILSGSNNRNMNFSYYIKHHDSIKCLLKVFIRFKLQCLCSDDFKGITNDLMQMSRLCEYIWHNIILFWECFAFWKKKIIK